MSPDAIAALTRRTAEAVSRRNSLLTLGGAALAAGLVPPLGSEAKKSAAKKAKKKCKRQVGQCTAFFNELCEEVECSAEQLEIVRRCCASFQSCNAGGFLECFVSNFAG
ncbi:MAG: hypothetical protein ACRDJC_04665 [Thermomicrobiales bacterium]